MTSYPVVRDSELSCQIFDEISLSLKGALFIKKIEYNNDSNREIELTFNSRKLFYPPSCDDFKCFIDGNLTKVKQDWNNYSKEIEIYCDRIIIPSRKKLTIEIICSWGDFYTVIGEFRYILYHPDAALYRLHVSNYSPIDNPYIIQINDIEASDGQEYHLLDNEIRFEIINLKPKEYCFIDFLSLSTPKSLPILSHIAVDRGTDVFSNNTIIIIQHLLSDAVHLIETIHERGADKEAFFILGIPYSTKLPVVKYLVKKGYKRIITPLDYPFEAEVETLVNEAINYSKETHKKIVIIEDGGYIVPILHEKFREYLNIVLGAVEQTANGIWRDKELIADVGIDYGIPIINVAESNIKKEFESPLIGKAIRKNLELLFNKTFSDISSKDIGLVGYGATGAEIARQLILIDSKLTIFDSKQERRNEAKESGYKVASSLQELVSSNDIIIEATGRYWYPKEQEYDMLHVLSSFKHNSYYLSASSKKLGINHNYFLKMIDAGRIFNIPGFGKRYKLIRDRKEITLIADGFPINFFIGESVPDKSIDFIIALLYKCAEIIALNPGHIEKGIIDINNAENDKWGFNHAQQTIRTLDELYNRG